MWDFLWFVLNPFYPLKNFQKDNVVHKSWFLGMPIDYYFSLGFSFLVALAGGAINWWLVNIGLFFLETIFVILFSLYVLKIDNWA